MECPGQGWHLHFTDEETEAQRHPAGPCLLESSSQASLVSYSPKPSGKPKTSLLPSLPYSTVQQFLKWILKMISGVCQEEKNKYILIQICGIKKSGIDDLICKAEIETEV